MTFDLHQILQSKAALRQRLTTLPIGEKLRLLDELRARALTLAARRNPTNAPRTGRWRDGESGK